MSRRVAQPQRTALLSIAAAAGLVALKLGVGLAAASLALVSAGIESSGDVLAAILTFFAVRLGRQPADPDHPYGHARAENLGALGEAAILLAGAVLVAVEAIGRLASPHGSPDTRWFVFAAIAVALAVDLARTVVSLRAARRHHSPALRSNAWHFAGDMVGSAAVLAGLLLVRAGFERGDAAAALAIAGLVFASAVRLIAENANVLMDRTPVQARAEAERAVRALAPEIELVRLRLRESGGRYFADVVAAVPPGQAVVEGHEAANAVERAIGAALPGTDVVVHLEPRSSGLDLRDGVLAIALAEPLVKEAHDVTIYEHDGSCSVSLHLKFPADLALADALAVSGRIEGAIGALAGVREVQTHLEPLERPLTVDPEAGQAQSDGAQEIERIVAARTGRSARAVRVLATQVGRVVFLTLPLAADTSLIDAHALAGELEEELRRELSGIADVVVHTEAA